MSYMRLAKTLAHSAITELAGDVAVEIAYWQVAGNVTELDSITFDADPVKFTVVGILDDPAFEPVRETDSQAQQQSLPRSRELLIDSLQFDELGIKPAQEDIVDIGVDRYRIDTVMFGDPAQAHYRLMIEHYGAASP